MADNVTIIDDNADAKYYFLSRSEAGRRIKLAVNIELNVEQAEAAIYGKCLAIHADADYVVFLTIEQPDGEIVNPHG